MILIITILILGVLLLLPPVQTFLAQKATVYLKKETGIEASIGKVAINVFGGVKIKKLLIKDHHQDTLISIETLKTNIIDINSWKKGDLMFGDIAANQLFLNVKQYKGEEDTNLDIFVDKLDDGEEGSGKFLMLANELKLTNSRFRMADYNREDYLDVDFTNLNAKVSEFKIKGPNVHGLIEKMSMKDHRSVVIEQMYTDFDYTKTFISLKDLYVKTSHSELQGAVYLNYERKDFQDFNNKVIFDVNLSKSSVNSNDIYCFFDGITKDLNFDFTGHLKGSLNDFKLVNVKLNQDSKTILNGDFRFENLFDRQIHTFKILANINEFKTTKRDLEGILPEILENVFPDELNKFGLFTVKGDVKLKYNELITDVDIYSDLGHAYSNLIFSGVSDFNNASYKGNVITNNFDVGNLLDIKDLKQISMNARLDGRGFSQDNLNLNYVGKISKIYFNSYEYQNIKVDGLFKKPIFKGIFNINDPNVFMDFNGMVDFSKKDNIYNFEAFVDYFDLYKTNWVTSDKIAIFKGDIVSHLSGNTLDNIKGDATLSHLSYQNSKRVYLFDEVQFKSVFNDLNHREITIDSDDLISGVIIGNYSFSSIGKMIENALGSVYSNYAPHTIKKSQFVNFNLNIHKNALEIFYPNLTLGKQTNLRGAIESGANLFNLNFNTTDFTIDDTVLHNIDIVLDNKNPLFNTYASIDSVTTKFYTFKEVNLLNVTQNDSLFIRTEFKGGKQAQDNFEFNLYHTINDDRNQVVGFLPSQFKINNFDWQLNKKDNKRHVVVFDKDFKNFFFDEFIVEHEKQLISFGGNLEPENKNFKLFFTDVGLQNIIPEIEDFDIKGILNGKLQITQNRGDFDPNSKLVINNLNINEIDFGTLNLDVRGNEKFNQFSVSSTLTNNNVDLVELEGLVNLEQLQTLDLDLKLQDFNIAAFKTLGTDVFSNTRGLVSGSAKIQGSFEQPEINGRLFLNEAGLKIPYLNVDYQMAANSIVDITPRQFIFRNITLQDTKRKTSGVLSGLIQHRDLSNWTLNLDLNTNNLLVLDTSLDIESLYYGTAFVNGKAKISGPIDALFINVDAISEKGTHIRIPINNTLDVGNNSFMQFVTREEKYSLDTQKSLGINSSGVELQFELDINENALIEVILDTDSAHGMKGRGRGILRMDINTNGKFNMWGDFQVYEGTYDFVYRNLIKKRFNVEKFGSIVWNGDPLKAQLDLTAFYKAQVNPTALLLNSEMSNRRIPVEVGIQITGNIDNPNPEFTIDFPNASPILQNELDTQLADKDTRDQQAIYLLATGSFFNTNNSMINQDMVYNNLFETASSMFGNFFGTNQDSDFTFNVGYNPGNNIDGFQQDGMVNLGTSFSLSDRISVNGQFGVPVGTQTETSVVGNVEFLYRVNQDGSLNLRAFNRENDINFIGEGIGFTQGIGLSYQVEFNNLRELSQKLFNKKSTILKANSGSQDMPDSFPQEFEAYRQQQRKKVVKERPDDVPPEID